MIKRPSGTSKPARDAFTLIELLVVISIIAILAAIAIPAVNGAIASSQSARCKSNLAQLGQAMLAYVADNNGYLALDTSAKDSAWGKLLGPYIPTAKGDTIGNINNAVYKCPAETNQPPGSFKNSVSHYTATYAVVNGSSTSSGPRKLAAVQNPSQTLLIVDGKLQPNNNSGYNCSSQTTFTKYNADCGKANPSATTDVAFRHNAESLNAVYVDGHVGTIFWTNRTSVSKAMWNGTGY